MRLLVTGDRNWKDKDAIRAVLEKLRPDVVIQGEARGADRLARDIAKEMGITVSSYPADWDQFGNYAGPKRNREMHDEGKPDLVVFFHTNLSRSKGTKDMIDYALLKGTRVERWTRILERGSA